MPLPPWFHRFCDPGADRFSVLVDTLEAALVPFDLVTTGGFRHVQVRGSLPEVPAAGEKLLIAHYDRVPGTPGANDNGASVLALVDYLSHNRTSAPLRVVFTDGEELPPSKTGHDQGSYALARSWGPVKHLLPVVLDMTGIGDTLVLGHLAEHLVSSVRKDTGPGPTKVRTAAKRLLSACGGCAEINTPFSDDLGLLLAGIPAAQVSLLPRKEADRYRQSRVSPGELSGTDPGELPPAWHAMHSPYDTPHSLWPESRPLIANVLEKFDAFPW